jgi:hypothetical protein
VPVLVEQHVRRVPEALAGFEVVGEQDDIRGSGGRSRRSDGFDNYPDRSERPDIGAILSVKWRQWPVRPGGEKSFMQEPSKLQKLGVQGRRRKAQRV